MAGRNLAALESDVELSFVNARWFATEMGKAGLTVHRIKDLEHTREIQGSAVRKRQAEIDELTLFGAAVFSREDSQRIERMKKRLNSARMWLQARPRQVVVQPDGAGPWQPGAEFRDTLPPSAPRMPSRVKTLPGPGRKTNPGVAPPPAKPRQREAEAMEEAVRVLDGPADAKEDGELWKWLTQGLSAAKRRLVPAEGPPTQRSASMPPPPSEPVTQRFDPPIPLTRVKPRPRHDDIPSTQRSPRGEGESGWAQFGWDVGSGHGQRRPMAEVRRQIGAAAMPAFAAALERIAGRQGNAEDHEAGAQAGETVEAFAARLGRAWSERLGGKPAPENKRDWLLTDHKDVQEAARRRYVGLQHRARWTNANKRRAKAGKPPLPYTPPTAGEIAANAAAVTRAWMTSRTQTMLFEVDAKTRRAQPLHPVAIRAPSARPTVGPDPLIPGSAGEPVAPVTSRFVRELKTRMPSATFQTYPRHGSGKLLGLGLSVDVYIPGQEADGFYPKKDAIRLLRAADEAARAVGADWLALYNDFAVADAVNTALGRRHVHYLGEARRGKLFWHGPAPLILHVHIDLMPREKAATGESETAHEAMARGGNGRDRAAAAFARTASDTFAAELVKLVGGKRPAPTDDLSISTIIAAAIAQARSARPVVSPAAVAPMAVAVHRALQPRMAGLARMAARARASAPAGEMAW